MIMGKPFMKPNHSLSPAGKLSPRDVKLSISGTLTVGLFILFMTATVVAQNVEIQEDEPFAGRPTTNKKANSSQKTSAAPIRSKPQSGFGIMARGGHIAGQAFGRDTSISPLEIFPYYMLDSALVFGDARLYISNDGQIGGNAGAGYRIYANDMDRIFGASVWYDADNTQPNLFQQVGFSLETYGKYIDYRSNFYFPVGDTERQFGTSLITGSTRFSGNNVLFDQYRLVSQAMRGIDMELGVPILGEFAREHALRVYGGGYFFQASDVQDINGWKARVQANVIAGLDAQIEVTNDQVYDTNVTFGVSWTFGMLHRSKLSQATVLGRIGEHVQRNYNVIAPTQKIREDGLLAINPATGNAYVLNHVASSAGSTGDGMVDNPFDSIASAQAAGGDIIYVHGGSVFTGADASIVLNEGERILGEADGVEHSIQVDHFGALLLPSASGAAMAEFRNAIGDSITLASGSEFSGFRVVNSGGHGIIGDGVSAVTLHDVTIESSGGSGLRFANMTGDSFVGGLNITGGNGPAIDVFGLSGTLEFIDQTNITNASTAAVNIDHLTSDSGLVVFNDLNVSGSQDLGISVRDSEGTILFGGTNQISNATNSTASLIDVRDSSANIAFGETNLTGHDGDAVVNLEDNTGIVSFGTLNINSNESTALRVRDSGALWVIDGGIVDVAAGGALDIEGTKLDAAFESVSSNGGDVGIRLVDNTGVFQVFGGTETGSGGLIQNANTGLLIQNSGKVGFGYIMLDGNHTGVSASNTNILELYAIDLRNSSGYAIDAMNVGSLTVTNSLIEDNGNSIRAQASTNGAYSFNISQNTIHVDHGDGIFVGTLPGTTNAALSLNLSNNIIENYGNGVASVKISWSSPLTARIEDNVMGGTGTSYRGLDITTTDPNSVTDISIARNSFAATGTNSTGIQLVTNGSSLISIGTNVLEFSGKGSTGMRFSLARSVDLGVTNNKYIDYADGGTSMVFDSVLGAAAIGINSNSAEFANQGSLSERGIIFSSVNNTNGTVRLYGTQNNTVNGAGSVFQAPLESLTGQFLINDIAVPVLLP